METPVNQIPFQRPLLKSRNILTTEPEENEKESTGTIHELYRFYASKSAATRFRSSRIAICCGQASSHLPHSLQNVAFASPRLL